MCLFCNKTEVKILIENHTLWDIFTTIKSILCVTNILKLKKIKNKL